MAVLEGTRKTEQFKVVSVVPDICLTFGCPVPYPIVATLDKSVATSPEVNFCKVPAFTEASRVSTVVGNEPGVDGGVVSTVNIGYCRPVPGMSSSTVFVNGKRVDYHIGTMMYMNCLGPEGPYNTIGIVVYDAPLGPSPISPGGRISSGFLSAGGMLNKLKGYAETAYGIASGAKKLYDIMDIDWSDPKAVLGAIGGVAGFAGLEGIQDAVKMMGQGYDLTQTDFFDPRSVLGALQTLGNMSGYKDLESAAKAAGQLNNIANTDFKNPQSVLMSATNLANLGGLNDMATGIARKAITGSRGPLTTAAPRDAQAPTAKPMAGSKSQLFSPPTNWGDSSAHPVPTTWMSSNPSLESLTGQQPKQDLGKPTASLQSANPQVSIDPNGQIQNIPTSPVQPENELEEAFLAAAGQVASGVMAGSPSTGASSSSGASSQQSTTVGSASGRASTPVPGVSPEELEVIRQQNRVAYDRYQALSPEQKERATISYSGVEVPYAPTEEQMTMFVPGHGYSSSTEEREANQSGAGYEKFVSDGFGRFFGMKKVGDDYLMFGGLVDLGSPETPGAGSAKTWWIPDNLFGADMTDFSSYHDEHYYGEDVDLSDMGEILSHEGKAFMQGLNLSSPLQAPLQVLYSAGTTLEGVRVATFNSLEDFYDSFVDKASDTASAAMSDINGILDGTGHAAIGDKLKSQFGLGGGTPPVAPAGSGGSGAGTGGAAASAGGAANGNLPIGWGDVPLGGFNGILITRSVGAAAASGAGAIGGAGAAAQAGKAGAKKASETTGENEGSEASENPAPKGDNAQDEATETLPVSSESNDNAIEDRESGTSSESEKSQVEGTDSPEESSSFFQTGSKTELPLGVQMETSMSIGKEATDGSTREFVLLESALNIDGENADMSYTHQLGKKIDRDGYIPSTEFVVSEHRLNVDIFGNDVEIFQQFGVGSTPHLNAEISENEDGTYDFDARASTGELAQAKYGYRSPDYCFNVPGSGPPVRCCVAFGQDLTVGGIGTTGELNGTAGADRSEVSISGGFATALGLKGDIEVSCETTP